ncbi:MAG: hypothetical protein WD766_03340 [Gemmatimonadota bacterium]
MKPRTTALARQYTSALTQPSDAPELDQLLRDYLAWNAEALDVLVAIYEAAGTGGEAPPEAGAFASKIASWENRLSQVLDRLARPELHGPSRIAAVG